MSGNQGLSEIGMQYAPIPIYYLVQFPMILCDHFRHYLGTKGKFRDGGDLRKPLRE